MKQITEDYVSFEIAKLLKEKGFDGECQGYYEVPTKLSSQKDVRKQLNVLPKNWNEYNKECVVCEYISISTHQMALKWLREVYNILIGITSYDGQPERLCLEVFHNGERLLCVDSPKKYEELVEEAIKMSLKNLI